MTVVIKPKRTSTSSKVPTTSDLVDGELGINTTDGKVYLRNGLSVFLVGERASNVLASSIVSGDTTHSPSGDAVFEALNVRQSGSYTPTCTGVLNVTSCSGNKCNWTRSGAGFVVSGSVVITPAAANAPVNVRISLPVVTAFTNSLDCSGPVSGKAAGVPSYEVGQVLAAAGTGDLQINFYPATTNDYTMRFCVAVPIM